MKVAWQILGMVLLVGGAQDAIRLLFDHDRGGVFGWVPGGFAAHLVCGIGAAVAGAALAGWATSKPNAEPEPSVNPGGADR